MKNSIQPSIQQSKPIVNAIRTNDGFIEITSLELLDEVAHSLVDKNSVYY
jgi:hypothetical protein